MHNETAPKGGKSVLLDEEDAIGKFDAAPGKDHLRRGPAFSFFLSRAAAQPATARDVIASRSVALAPVTVAVGAQTMRALLAWWRFAPLFLIAATVVVAGNGLYFGEIADQATKAAKLQQESDRAAAFASELARFHRNVDTTVALSTSAGDEVTNFKQEAEKGSAELRQSLQKEQERAELEQELAMARARIYAFDEAQARQASDHAAELQQALDSAAELRTSLQQERDRASRLEQDVAAARRDIEEQTALAAKAGEEARQMKQAADSAAELQKSLEQEQEQERTARLEQDVAAAQRDLEKQIARPAKASRQASQTKRRAESSAAGWYRSSSIWNYVFAPPRRRR